MLRRDDPQAGDTRELGHVFRDDAERMGQRSGGDPEVVGADHRALLLESRPELGMDARNGISHRYRDVCAQQLLDEGASSWLVRSSGTVNPVHQLTHGDDADRCHLVADRCLDRGSRSLRLDQDVGVDQDGQCDSGGPSERRASITSRAKSSSTGGRDSINSRSSCGDRNRLRRFGGPITATVWPLRVISISSPSATRLRIDEKERATSVALSRSMAPAYQRNQIPNVSATEVEQPPGEHARREKGATMS